MKRLLGALTVLVLGPRAAADPLVRDLLARVRTLEDDMEHERRERKLLAGDVEAQLDLATKRYSKARASEARANGGSNGGKKAPYATPEQFAYADGDGFDRWIAAGRPPGYVEGVGG